MNNYNYGRFLGNAVDSALAQTYDAVNVIVVDDGSTDDSRQVIESYGADVTAVFKENGGQASAFNGGFARSSGDIVILLDADDVLAADVGERVVAAFAADPSLAKVQYRLEVIDGEGRRTGIVNPAAYLPLRGGDLRREELMFPFDLTWMATSGNAFAANALRRIFPVPEDEFPLHADAYVSHLTPLLGRVAWLDGIGGYYRVHGANRFALARPKLDLDHVRGRIIFVARTRPHLERLAIELGVMVEPRQILSVSDVACRLTSLKLDPARHPVAGDTIVRLLAEGARASARRFDVRMPMRALFILWFAAIAAAPRPLATALAELFSLPERRRRLNRALRRLHAR